MGRQGYKSSSFGRLDNQHNAYYRAIHRATVQDVSIARFSVRAVIEASNQVVDVLIPLMGMSLLPGTVDEGRNAAWGRYIPQVGDVILVGFDTSGKAYSLGYHAISVAALDQYDVARTDRGGIGWGAASNVDLKPGDWDFFSARNSRMMLTDRAVLSSGPHSLILDKPNQRSVLTSDLAVVNYGYSSLRMGNAKRQMLPTEPETDVFSTGGTTAQEYNNVVKKAIPAVPLGFELTRHSMGEVIDELTKLPMVPSTGFPELTSVGGMGVRSLLDVKNATGEISNYAEIIDDLGNYGVSAKTATGFQWNTPLADFDTLCKSKAIVASDKWELTTNSYKVTCTTYENNSTSAKFTTTDFAVDSPKVGLGTGAYSPLVKGQEYQTAFNVFMRALSGAAGTWAGVPDTAPAFATAITAACSVFLETLPSTLSQISKTS